MKTGLPLPNNEKQVFVSQEIVQKLPVPFCSANAWNVSFTQSDINYIENVIKMHKSYRSIYENHLRIYNRGHDYFRSIITLARFYDLFVNDNKCPANLKSFLNMYILRLNKNVQQFKAQKEITEMNFMVNRWMETCR